MDENERVEADDGYAAGDPKWVKTRSGYLHDDRDTRKNVRARHETANKRMKQWNCLRLPFFHAIDKHGMCFRAVAVITQLSFNNGKTLFQIEGYN